MVEAEVRGMRPGAREGQQPLEVGGDKDCFLP